MDFRIDPEACVACLACVRVCPSDAIAVDENRVWIVDEACTRSSLCFSACPHEAVIAVGDATRALEFALSRSAVLILSVESAAYFYPATPEQVEAGLEILYGQEADEMISVPTGVAYRDSENAFRYRQASWERPDNCGCGPERGFEVVAGERRSEPPLADADATTEDEGADSQEEQASLPARSGSFHIQEAPAEVRDDEPPVEDAARAAADADEIDDTTTASQRPLVEDDENRRIRVVGPRFLPDPEEAIDLRAPAPARAR